MKHKLNSKLRDINNLRYADNTTLMAESKGELKSLLMKVKEESEESGFKLNIQKMEITASGPITSWQIEGETVETVRDFIFLGSKITADGDAAMKLKDTCSLEEKLWQTKTAYLKSSGDLRWYSGTPLQYSCLENPMDGGAW